MEEKIYQRQVTKQSLALRGIFICYENSIRYKYILIYSLCLVVDEHQLDRHFTSQELRELYAFEPHENIDNSDIPIMPRDDLLKQLLLDCRRWIVRYHEHDSLLENRIDQGLSEEDQKAAWAEYDAERTAQNRMNNEIAAASVPSTIYNNVPSNVPSNVLSNIPGNVFDNLSSKLSGKLSGSTSNFVSFDSILNIHTRLVPQVIFQY